MNSTSRTISERNGPDPVVRWIMVAAAIAGGLGVAIGAFGAHGLSRYLATVIEDPGRVMRRLDQFDVGVRYHLLHAVAMLALAALPLSHSSRRRVAIGFVLGILFFSGSLYLLVILDLPILGAVTPIGGVCWIVAWMMLVVAAWRS